MVVPGCASWLEAIGSEMALDDAAVELDTALDEAATELETALEDAAAELETALEDAATELETVLDEAAAELETALVADPEAADAEAEDEAIELVADEAAEFVAEERDVACEDAKVGWLEAGRTGTTSSSLQAGRARKMKTRVLARASHGTGCCFIGGNPPWRVWCRPDKQIQQ